MFLWVRSAFQVKPVNKKRAGRIGMLVIAALLTAGASLTHSYGLQQRDREMIAVAYLNGAADALRFDIEKIMALKADGMLLRQTVEDAAQIYLIKVERINLTRQQAQHQARRAASGKGTTTDRNW